jgi:hypothetical protein
VCLGCSLWLRPEVSTERRSSCSGRSSRGDHYAPSVPVVEEVALRPSRGPPIVWVAGTTTAPGGFGRFRSWVVAVAESGRCWSRWASGRRPHHPPWPAHRGSGLLLVVAARSPGRNVGRAAAVGCRDPRCVVPFGGRGGRSATVSRHTERVGGRYDDCFGRLGTCGSWVVAVGGVGEMPVAVGVGSPSPSPAVAVPPWAWAAPCGGGPKSGTERRSSCCRRLWRPAVRRPFSVVEEVALRPSRDPPSVRVAGTTTAPGGFGRFRSWVVAVGGVGEMLVAVGGGSPSPSPAAAGAPLAWAAPCGDGPRPPVPSTPAPTFPKKVSAALWRTPVSGVWVSAPSDPIPV